MKTPGKIIRSAVFIGLFYLGLILTSDFLSILSPFGGYDLVFGEFISGFWFFLRGNFPAISWDAGTWGPGLGAFLLALSLGHRFLAAWAVRTNRYWSFASSLCLALILPTLFVIALIVPGVLLQWEFLRQIPWTEINR